MPYHPIEQKVDFSWIGEAGNVVGNLVTKYPELKLISDQAIADEKHTEQLYDGLRKGYDIIGNNSDYLKEFAAKSGLDEQSARAKLAQMRDSVVLRPGDLKANQATLNQNMRNLADMAGDKKELFMHQLATGLDVDNAKTGLVRLKNADGFKALADMDFDDEDKAMLWVKENLSPDAQNDEMVKSKVQAVGEAKYQKALQGVNETLKKWDAGLAQYTYENGKTVNVGRGGDLVNLRAYLELTHPDAVNNGIIDKIMSERDKDLNRNQQKDLASEQNATEITKAQIAADTARNKAEMSYETAQGKEVAGQIEKIMNTTGGSIKTLEESMAKALKDGNDKEALRLSKEIAKERRYLAGVEAIFAQQGEISPAQAKEKIQDLNNTKSTVLSSVKITPHKNRDAFTKQLTSAFEGSRIDGDYLVGGGYRIARVYRGKNSKKQDVYYYKKTAEQQAREAIIDVGRPLTDANIAKLKPRFEE